MRIGLAQIDCVENDVVANTEKITSFIERAANENCDLVVFPEMSDTGYLLKEAVKIGQSWDGGTVQQIAAGAKQNQINVIAGVSERDNEDVYNAIISINSTGEITSRYRKTHLITVEPMFEHTILGRGEQLGLGQVSDFTAGFMTCYEVRFPEVSRSLALNGARIIILPAAWPLVRAEHWDVLTRARAIENQLFVVAADRVGTDGPGLTFAGASQVIDPFGNVVACASETDEELLVVDVDLTEVDNVRSRMKIFDDRRPELYGELVRE